MRSSHDGAAANVRWAYIDGVWINVFATGSGSQEEYRRYVADYDGLPELPRAVLVVSSGGGPTTRQRADFSAKMKANPDIPVSIVTSSRISRGIMTAIGWMLPNVVRHWRAFAPERIGEALEWLRLEREAQRRVYRVTVRLSESMGHPLPPLRRIVGAGSNPPPGGIHPSSSR